VGVELAAAVRIIGLNSAVAQDASTVTDLDPMRIDDPTGQANDGVHTYCRAAWTKEKMPN
jgi:hypothetical protein